jgi:hypothetical protein
MKSLISLWPEIRYGNMRKAIKQETINFRYVYLLVKSLST